MVQTVETAERNERGVLAFPRFYIKSVGGQYSLHHRLTHSYIGSFPCEETLKAAVKTFSALTVEQEWEWLMSSRGFSMTAVSGNVVGKKFEHEEDWYFGAWGGYTTRFYEGNPTLFEEVKELPRGVISSIKVKINERQNAAHKAHSEEVSKIEEAIKVQSPASKKLVRKSTEEESVEKPPLRKVVVKKKKVIKRTPAKIASFKL